MYFKNRTFKKITIRPESNQNFFSQINFFILFTVLLCGSGVQYKKYVSDDQLQSASYWYNNNENKYKPIYGRLYQISIGGAWIAAKKAESSSYNGIRCKC